MKSKQNTVLGKCRFCDSPLVDTFVDLGMSPLCEDHVKPEELKQMEPFYPLHSYVCSKCFLVQVEGLVSPSEIFSDYAYFSSYSDSWLKHIKNIRSRCWRDLRLQIKAWWRNWQATMVTCWQYFLEKKIPVLGIEACG